MKFDSGSCKLEVEVKFSSPSDSFHTPLKVLDIPNMAAAAASANDLRRRQQLARDNAKHFLALIDLTDKSFSDLPKDKRKRKLWDLLGLNEADFKLSKNVARTSIMLRELFSEYSAWVDRGALMSNRLLDGVVGCTYCNGTDAQFGCVQLVKTSMESHQSSVVHKRKVAEFEDRRRRQTPAPHQQNIEDVGFVHKPAATTQTLARVLISASFIAGGSAAGSSCGGVSYTALPFLLRQQVLQTIALLNSGIATSKTLRTGDIKDAVAAVAYEIKKKVQAIGDFALSIDGISSNLALGAKYVTVSVLSPALERPLTVSLTFSAFHENADMQVCVCMCCVCAVVLCIRSPSCFVPSIIILSPSLLYWPVGVKPNHDGSFKSGSAGIREFMSEVERLKNPDVRASLLSEVIEECKEQQTLIKERSIAYGELKEEDVSAYEVRRESLC